MNGLSLVCSIKNIDRDVDYINKNLIDFIALVRISGVVHEIREIVVDYKLQMIFIEANKGLVIEAYEKEKI